VPQALLAKNGAIALTGWAGNLTYMTAFLAENGASALTESARRNRLSPLNLSAGASASQARHLSGSMTFVAVDLACAITLLAERFAGASAVLAGSHFLLSCDGEILRTPIRREGECRNRDQREQILRGPALCVWDSALKRLVDSNKVTA
jgi:hypothetical protein